MIDQFFPCLLPSAHLLWSNVYSGLFPIFQMGCWFCFAMGCYQVSSWSDCPPGSVTFTLQLLPHQPGNCFVRCCQNSTPPLPTEGLCHTHSLRAGSPALSCTPVCNFLLYTCCRAALTAPNTDEQFLLCSYSVLSCARCLEVPAAWSLYSTRGWGS